MKWVLIQSQTCLVLSLRRATIFESVMGSPEVFVDRAPTCLVCQPRSGLRIWDNQDGVTLDGVTLDGHCWMEISICKFWTIGISPCSWTSAGGKQIVVGLSESKSLLISIPMKQGNTSRAPCHPCLSSL